MAKTKNYLLSLARRIDRKKDKNKNKDQIDFGKLAVEIDKTSAKEEEINLHLPSIGLQGVEDETVLSKEKSIELPSIPDKKEELPKVDFSKIVPVEERVEKSVKLELSPVSEKEIPVKTEFDFTKVVPEEEQRKKGITTEFLLPSVPEKIISHETISFVLPSIPEQQNRLKPIEIDLPSIEETLEIPKSQRLDLPVVETEVQTSQGRIDLVLPSIPEQESRFKSIEFSLPSISKKEEDELRFIPLDLPVVSEEVRSQDSKDFILPKVQEREDLPESIKLNLPIIQDTFDSIRQSGGLNLPVIQDSPGISFPQFDIPLNVASSIDSIEEIGRRKESPYDATKILASLATEIDKGTVVEKQVAQTISPFVPTAQPAGEYWEKVITFENISLNSGINSADISDNQLRTASHIIFDNDGAEKAGGRTVLAGCPLESGDWIDGIWRSHNKSGDKKLITACNGKILYQNGAVFSATTPATTGLTEHVRYSFLNHNDKTLITNGYDPPLEFDPKDASIRTLGLEPPRFYKKVAYFETDETITGDGQSLDTVFFRQEERTGVSKRSLKVTATAGTTKYGYVTYAAAQNFSVFPNGISIGNDDYVVVWVLHRERDYISSIYIDFWTTTGSYYRATIDAFELDPIYLRDNQWTELKIKKSRFAITGTPAWNNINRTYFYVTSITGESQVNFDNCYWKNTPMEVLKYKKQIDSFETGLSTWTTTGTVQDDLQNVKELTKAIKLKGASSSILKTVSLDLTQYIDGLTSQTSDEVFVWTYIKNTTYLTSVTLTLSETPGSKYFTKQYTVAGGDFTKGTYVWKDLKTAKSAFTNTGSASWGAITQIKIETVGTADLQATFDDWCLQEASLNLDLATMDPSEAWAFPTVSGCSGSYNNDPKYTSQGEYSLKLVVKAKSTFYATKTLTTPLNLTQFGGGEGSGDNDKISFWFWWHSFKGIKKIELRIDCNTGDYATDYFRYEIEPEYIIDELNLPKTVSKNSRSMDFEFEKGDFTRVGDTADKGWATVKGYRIITETGSYGTTFYTDYIHMIRQVGLTGIYQWCCVFVGSDGVYSAPSEWSEVRTLSGTRALLTNIPISADTNVSAREIYRKGGALGDIARLSFTINNNTLTQDFDDIADELTGGLLETESIPNGTIRVPLCKKWVGKFRERGILILDPLNLRRLYFSNIGHLYAWSELQAWDFDSDILDGFIKDDILFVNCKSGIKRITDDLGSLSGSSMQETGLVKHSISPFGAIQCDEEWAFVSYDGAYLFNGYNYKLISDLVKDYFDPVSYYIEDAVAFYRKKHLYISVKASASARTLLDCYLPKMAWRTSDYIVNCFCIYDGQGDNGEIYIGDLSGNIYQFETGYASTSVLETKDFSSNPANPFQEVIIRGVDVIARSVSSYPGYLSLKFRVDQVQNDSIVLNFPEFQAVNFTGSGLNDFTCSAVQAAAYTGTTPLRIRIKITSTGTPDKYKQSLDEGETWSAEANVAATITISAGVQGTFGATTGHTVDNQWDFIVSHLKSTYTLYKSQISGVKDYVKGASIGARLYPGVTDKHFGVKAIRIFGEIAPITKQMEE